MFPVRVYYEDTDAHGIVYHGSMVRFLDRGRTEWLRSRGVDMETLATDDNMLFVVRSLQLRYSQPAQYGMLLQVTARCISRSRSSILIGQRILSAAGDCICDGEVRVVCIDAACRRPRSLPSYIEELCTP